MSIINKKLANIWNQNNDQPTSQDSKEFHLKILLSCLNEHQEIVDSYEHSKAEIERIEAEIKEIDPDGKILRKIIFVEIEKE